MRHRWSIVLGLGLSLTVPAFAVDQLRYVELQPSFVTNFGVSENGHLNYLKADVVIRVRDQAGAAAAKYHLPALRNSLVLLFSRQDEATLTSGEGREEMRLEALAELRQILERETGKPYIEDLVFTNFIVQR